MAIGYRESSIPLSYLSARNEPIGYSIPPVEATPYDAGYDTPGGSTRGTDGL